jgi:phosphoribosylformylglycinamidine synthase
VGADPIAITDNLNFGNPERPEIMGQIVRAIEGMAEACRALDFPIVSGNVSLYNETRNDDGTSSAILPTPAIGGVGLIEDWRKSATIGFKERGQVIWLVGSRTFGRHLGQSLWLREVLGREVGPPPPVDLERERATGDFIRRLIASGDASAVHDVSDGGLLVAIAEMALAGGIGAEVCPDDDGYPRNPEDPLKGLKAEQLQWPTLAERLFGEDQGRYLVTLARPLALKQLALDAGSDATMIGTTGFFSTRDGCEGIWDEASDAFVSLDDLRRAHEGFFPNLMGADAALA